MKIKIANQYTYNLDLNLSMEERLIAINVILKEEISIGNGKISIQDYFLETWDKNNTRTCLDIIGYYLTKENHNKRDDSDIISRRKYREMVNWNDRYSVFSDLSIKDQLQFGFKDYEDETENQKRKNQDSH